MPDNKPKFKRRKLFIDKAFQLGFMMRFGSLVIAGGMASVLIMYLLSLRSVTVAFLNSKVVALRTANFILPLLLQSAAVVAILTIVVVYILAVLISHRMYGPLYRFKTVMKMMERGEFPTSFQVRKKDQLQDMAKIFNSSIVKTRGELLKIKNSVLHLKGKLDSIQDSDLPQGKRTVLKEVRKMTDEIDRAISFFKI